MEMWCGWELIFFIRYGVVSRGIVVRGKLIIVRGEVCGMEFVLVGCELY